VDASHPYAQNQLALAHWGLNQPESAVAALQELLNVQLAGFTLTAPRRDRLHRWGWAAVADDWARAVLGRLGAAAPSAELPLDVRATAGQPAPLVDLRLADPDTGEIQPWDGRTSGELQASGPWIADSYYLNEDGGKQFTADGWLRTGDVAVIDPNGYVKLVDRTKDLVKSGGEWISSVDLENEIMAMPEVAEAAVIAIPDEKWSERPLACVVVRAGSQLTAQQPFNNVIRVALQAMTAALGGICRSPHRRSTLA